MLVIGCLRDVLLTNVNIFHFYRGKKIIRAEKKEKEGMNSNGDGDLD